MERIAHAYPLRALSLLLVICLAFCWPAPALADSASASDATASSIPQAETPTYKVAFYLHAVRGSAAQPALSRWQGPGPTPCTSDPVYVLVPAFASCANGSNACCWNSGLMPMPVSAHVISNVATSSVAESSRHVMARSIQRNSALCGRSSAAISRAGTRWKGAAFSISITNNKARDVSLLRLAMPPCLHVIRESTIKCKKDEP